MKASDVCLQLAPRLSSGNFFAGMQVVQTDARREFRKGQINVTSFPPLIHVDMIIYATDCASGRDLDSSESLAAVRSVIISAQWKRELEYKAAVIKSQSIRKPAVEEWSEDVPKWLLDDRNFSSMIDSAWDVDLAIEGHDIPITDSLVVTARAEGEKQPLRFVARL